MPPPFRPRPRCRRCGRSMDPDAGCPTCDTRAPASSVQGTPNEPPAQVELPPWDGPIDPAPPVPPPVGPAYCPRCGTSLGPETVAGVPMLGCEACGGLALTHAAERHVVARPELHAALLRFDDARLAERGATAHGVRYLTCPSCPSRMARQNFGRVSGVIVDRCPQHGTWLDVGELARILRFLAEGGRDKQRRFEAREQALQDYQREQIRRIDGDTSLLARRRRVDAWFGDPWPQD